MLQLHHLYVCSDGANNEYKPDSFLFNAQLAKSLAVNIVSIYTYGECLIWLFSCSLVLQTDACHSVVAPWQPAGTQTLPGPGCSLPWVCVTLPAVPHSCPAGG